MTGIGQCDYRPFEYVRSNGKIQHRFNITSGLNDEGRKIYSFEYEELPDDGSIPESQISVEPSISDAAEYTAFVASREE